MDITASEFKIPFKTAFKHAKAERRSTQSIFASVQRNGAVGIGEACPRQYVTGETVGSCLKWIRDNKTSIACGCRDLKSLNQWRSCNQKSISRNPSAWCAVELALLDLFAIEENISVEELLDLESSSGTYQYTAVIGDCKDDEFNKVFSRYSAFGFRDYKLKISGNADSDMDKIKKIAESAGNVRIRLDGNNIWSKDYQKAKSYLGNIDHEIFAIEEPLGVRDFGRIEKLSNALSIPVILDESVCNLADIRRIPLVPEKCIINVRISKMGGLLTSLRMIEISRERGFKVIIGCMVGETTLLGRAALIAAKFSSTIRVAQEGAFSDLLLEYDPVRPKIKFGEKGILRFKETKRTDVDWQPGWGLSPVEPETVNPS